MKRTKKLAVAFGILVALAVLLVGVYGAEENIRGRVLRPQAEHRLKDQGEPSTFADLHLPTVPEGGNAGPAIMKLAAELRAIVKTKPLFRMPPSGLMSTDAEGHAAVRFRDSYFPASKFYEPSKKDKSTHPSVGTRPSRVWQMPPPYWSNYVGPCNNPPHRQSSTVP